MEINYDIVTQSVVRCVNYVGSSESLGRGSDSIICSFACI